MRFILSFGSVHKVLKAESILKKKGIVFRLDPAPTVVTVHCDLVITVEEDELEKATRILLNAGLKPSSIYRKDGGGYVKV